MSHSRVTGTDADITTGLSRIKWLFVIARNSRVVSKGKQVDVRQVGRELGVRYVLEGGVRTLFRDGELVAIGQKAALVLGALVRSRGQVRTKTELIDAGKRSGSLDAYDLYLRARQPSGIPARRNPSIHSFVRSGKPHLTRTLVSNISPRRITTRDGSKKRRSGLSRRG